MSLFKSLPARDVRALLALIASIGGTMALTTFAVGIVWILWKGGWALDTAAQRIDKIGLALVLVLVIMGLTMTGLGLAINRRQLKANIGGSGFEASGGDEGPAAAQAVAEVAKDKADEITEDAKP